MQESTQNFKGIYQNSFASLLFPDKPESPVKNQIPVKKKTESSKKASFQPGNPLKKQENKPIHHINNTKPNSQPKTNNNTIQKAKNIKSTGNIHHKQNVPNMKPIMNEKKKETNNLLDKLKNFDSLEALENELQKNKHEFKKLFPDEIKDNILKSRQTISKTQASKNKNHSTNQIPLTNKKSTVKNKNDINFLQKKRNPSIPSTKIDQSQKKSNSKIPTKQQPQKQITNKSLTSTSKGLPKVNCTYCQCIHPLHQHVKPIAIKQIPVSPKNEFRQGNKIITPLTNNKIPQNKPSSQTRPNAERKEYNPTQPPIKNISQKPKRYNPFAKTKEDDNFIVHDNDEDDRQYKKYLAKINDKLMRGRMIFDDTDDLEEANFDLIQREEKITEKIGEYEDKIEELKEIERLKRKGKI